jgi:hypothetical protein
VEQRLRLQAEGVAFRGRRVDIRGHEHKFNKPRRDSRPRPRSKRLASNN